MTPALLCSYIYLPSFERHRELGKFRNWALDSGAFSAHNIGALISLEAFIDKALELQKTDPKLVEIFALDVIGDWRASEKNTEAMVKAGVQAIPTWHAGEPWEHLVHLAKSFPKIAVGGLVGIMPGIKRRVIERAFSLIWPAKIHGFGVGDERLIMDFPFHSVDATSWTSASKFGVWSTFGGAHIPARLKGSVFDSEVKYYLTIEKKAQARWRSTVAKLGWEESPTVRLAVSARPKEMRMMKEFDL